jgi:hypothetical protein
MELPKAPASYPSFPLCPKPENSKKSRNISDVSQQLFFLVIDGTDRHLSCSDSAEAETDTVFSHTVNGFFDAIWVL